MKLLSGIFAIAVFTVSSLGQTAPPPKNTPSPTPAQRAAGHSALQYKIPSNVVSGTRHDIDAGSRGWNERMPSLYVLAPNHTGLTTRGQPSLFWYQSGPASTRIEFALIEPGKPKPILRVGADKSDQTGIHRIMLSRYNISLAPGVLYKWTVSLVPNPAARSQDVIASDTIQRIEPDAQLVAALGSRSALERAGTYARRGIWYDALEAITNEIETAPKDKELRRLRAAFLEQVDLRAVALTERK